MSGSDSRPQLSVLLVNWNTRQMTLECLGSIYAETRDVTFEVIVVDNGSVDGSAAAIAAAYPQVRLLAEAENHGFARATNLQAKVARGEKLLLLNTDTVVLDRAIDRLFAFAQARPEAKIWGGRTLSADGSLNPTSCWGPYSLGNQLAVASGLAALFPSLDARAYPGWRRDSEREVAIVTGCLLMIDRIFWEELGGFDPAFFMFGEEADLCLRAARRGARPRITPDATVIHYDGGSTRVKTMKIVHTLSAEVGLMQRHVGGWRAALSPWVLSGGVLLRRLAYGAAAWWRPQRYREEAAAWREVWRRRREWRGGPIEVATR